MDRFAAQQAVSRFLDVPSGQIQPARLDPAAVPLADANQDGHVAADELVEALVADRVRIDAARQKVVPMVAALVDDAPPAAAPDSLPAAEGPPAALDAVPDAGEPAVDAVPPAGQPPAPDAVAKGAGQPRALPQPTLPQAASVVRTGAAAARGNPLPPPPARPNEPLMAAPKPSAGPSASVSTRGVDLTAPVTEDGTIRFGMHVDTDPAIPQKGAMLLEESHPQYLTLSDVLGSGLKLGLDSRTRAELYGVQAPVGQSGATTMGVVRTNIRHEHRITAERAFDVFGLPGNETTLRGGYLLGFDLTRTAQGTATPERQWTMLQYATLGAETKPTSRTRLSVEGYLPVQNGSFARGEDPLLRIGLGLSPVSLGTTQSRSLSRYDAQLALPVPTPLGNLTFSSSVAVDHDRTADRVGMSGGVQFGGNF